MSFLKAIDWPTQMITCHDPEYMTLERQEDGLHNLLL